MSLSDHFQTRTPLVWVHSDEPHRVLAAVLDAAGERQVYRLNPLKGLEVHLPGKGWKGVLLESPEPDAPPSVTFNMQRSLMEVLARNGVMVIDYAHTSAEDLAPFYGEITRKWLDIVASDDADALTPQFFLISHKDNVPGEIAREVVVEEFSLPEVPTLQKMTDTLTEDLDPPPEPATKAQIVRAVQGLSESEYYQATFDSLKRYGRLDVDFLNHRKIDIIQRGGTLEIRPPSLDLSDIGGLDLAKNLIQRIILLWDNPEDAKAFQVEPLRRVLMVGVPGSGKSAICEATASGLGLDLAKMGIGRAMSKWVGESESNMRKTFAQIKVMAPILAWIDELGRDLSGSASSSQTDSGTTDRVHGEFLTGLQELPDNVFLMCAANRIDGLPPEMLRADRFDKIMFIGLPTYDERKEIFKIHLGTTWEQYNLDELAQATREFTGAEIKGLIKDVRFDISPVERRPITTEELIAAAPHTKGRVWNNHKAQLLEMYERARNEWNWASSTQAAEAQELIKKMRSQLPKREHGHTPMPRWGESLRGSPEGAL